MDKKLNDKLYNIVKAQGDFEKNIKYRARLTEGRKAFGLNKDYITDEDKRKDEEKARQEKTKQKKEAQNAPIRDTKESLTGKVGKVDEPDEKTNLPENIRFVQKLLNNIADKKTGAKYLTDGALNSEVPYQFPYREFPGGLERDTGYKPFTPYIFSHEYLSKEATSFEQKYPNTYKAIVKFQKDFGLKQDGEVWPNNKAIEKLVALSNRAAKNKEKEAEKKQEEEKEAKKKPSADSIKTLTGRVGQVAKPDDKTNLPGNISFVQKLLHNITDQETGEKYLGSSAYNDEFPFNELLPESPWFLNFTSTATSKPELPYLIKPEQASGAHGPQSFEQKYPNTYKAIVKFQKDFGLKQDGEVWPNNKAIEKLVALSNRAAKNKEKEAEKKQEEKKEVKKKPSADSKETLTGRVGQVAKPDDKTNLPGNISFVQKLLHNITDKETEKKYLGSSAYNDEFPFKELLPESPWELNFDRAETTTPLLPYLIKPEQASGAHGTQSFERKYPNTYKAIVKFQKDFGLKQDGEVWPNNKAIEKLVALSNRAAKNEEKEAEKKQEEKKEVKKDPTKDTIDALTGTIGLVKDENKKPHNESNEIAFVQKLLNNITYYDKGIGGIKYLEDAAFNSENPNRISFLSGLDWINNTKPEEFNAFTLEEPKSFDRDYPHTYKAIIKFQKDHCRFTPDGVVGAGYGTIKKLVALSNQATKNREIAAIEKERAAIAQKESDELDDLVKDAMDKLNKAGYAAMLKSELLENPKFVARFITKLGGKAASYQLVKELMNITSQRDLVKIDANLDKILFDTLYKNGDIEKDVKDLLRLRTGKKKYGVDGSFSTIENIISKDDWRSQIEHDPKYGIDHSPFADNEAGGTACKYISEKIIYRHLYEELDEKFLRNTVTKNPQTYEYILGATGAHQFLSILKEDKSEYKNIEEGVRKQSTFYKAETFDKGMNYINQYLEVGMPVLVGVDHTFNRNLDTDKRTTSKIGYGSNEGTTDHFIVVIGRGTTKEGKRYYQFFDPGTSRKGTGTSKENMLVENEDGHFTCPQPYHKDRLYHLTMVVLYTKDFKQYASEIEQNALEEAKLSTERKNKENDFQQ